MIKAFSAGKDFIAELTDQDTYGLKKDITDDDVIKAAQAWTAQLQLESQAAIDENVKSFVAGAVEKELTRRMIVAQSQDIAMVHEQEQQPARKPPLGKIRNFDD